MRRSIIFAAAALSVSTSLYAPVAAAAASSSSAPAGTVNSFTPAEERRARAAATRAGYRTDPAVWAQAGYLFFNATKGGQRYQLTVAPDGKVFASSPTPITPATAAR